MTIKRTGSFYSNVRDDKQFLWTPSFAYPALHDLNIFHRLEETAEATSENLSRTLKGVSTISL